jgi:hypothetical protein
MNATLGTADASGDLLPEGDQSRLFGAGWRAGDEQRFAGCAHNVVLRKIEIQSVTYFSRLRRSSENRTSIGTYYKTTVS